MTTAQSKVIKGVLLGGPKGLRLVPLDGNQRLLEFGLQGQAADAIDHLHPEGVEAFARMIRERPKTTVCGDFTVHRNGLTISLVHADVRAVTDIELAEAHRIDLDQALTELRNAGIRPTMSAEELLELTRGGDDEPVAPSP
ncbi:hypothetical protein ACVIGB_000605 [Bradyrhizobium sp. USDA 4341]